MKKQILLCVISISGFLNAASSSEPQATKFHVRPEAGFVRRKNGEIKVVAYRPDEQVTIARLIDAHVEGSGLPSLSAEASTQARATAVLLKHLPKAVGYGETTTLDNDFVIRRSVRCPGQSGDYHDAMEYTSSGKKSKSMGERDGNVLQIEKDYNKNQHWLEQIIQKKCFYTVGSESANYPKEKEVLPFVATDHAAIDSCGFWLVVSEGGHLVNLYPLRDFGIDKRVRTGNPEDWMTATLYNPARVGTKSRKQGEELQALTLRTKPEGDKDAFIYSFALTRNTNKLKVALISPREVTLWQPEGYSDASEAYGKRIACAQLAADLPLDRLYCFNSGVFSPDDKYLYIAGSHFVWRYAIEDEALEQFRYTSIPGLSGKRPIAINASGACLAIADPRAGVSVFETDTMQLLCTFNQGLKCALLAFGAGNRLATSVPCEDGPSQDSIWQIKPVRVKKADAVADAQPAEQGSGWGCMIQ